MRASSNSSHTTLPEQRRRQLREYLNLARSVIGDDLIRQPELDETYFSSIREAVITEFRGREVDLEKTFLRQLIITVGRWYNIRFPALKVKYASLENGAAAMVFRKSGQFYLHFNTRYCRDDTRLTMLVAHEMAHIVLGQHRVFLEPTKRNEELTDTLAVLAGFGAIYRAGCLVTVKNPVKFFGRASASREEALGYLTRKDIDYLLGEKARIRKQAEVGYTPDAGKNSRCGLRPIMNDQKQALLAESERRLRRVYRSLVQDPEQERVRLSGFMQAGIFLGLASRQELDELVGRVHLEELGETIEERRGTISGLTRSSSQSIAPET